MKREKLVKARRSKGLTQQQLADAVGITRKALSECERGKSNPYPDTIKRLKDFFDKSAEELDLVVAEALDRFPDAPVTGAYGRWERGIRKPKPYYQEKLYIIYGKSASQLCLAPLENEHDLSAVPTSSSENMVQSEDKEPIIQISQRSNAETDPPQEQENITFIPEERMIIVSLEAAKISMSEALWTLAFLRDLNYEEKRGAIRQAVKKFDAMNTDDKGYPETRREAIRSLARLAFVTLGLSIPNNTIKPERYGDALTYCAAALEGCEELYWSDDPEDVQQAFLYTSMYLPILKMIAKASATYRGEALGLATRYALLKAKLGWECTGMTETLSYAKEAVALSKETGDTLLQLSAYIKLAWGYFYDQKYHLAWATIQEGESILRRYQQMSNMPALPSSVIGSFYSAYAITQTKNGQSPDRALGIALDSAPSTHPVAFMDFSRHAQLKEAAQICYYNGDQEQAMIHLEKKIDPETLVPRIPQSEVGRINTIHILLLSMLKSQERDIDKIIHHWKEGMQGAKAAKSEGSFRKFAAIYEAMEFAWPGEQRVLKSREHIVHWTGKTKA